MKKILILFILSIIILTGCGKKTAKTDDFSFTCDIQKQEITATLNENEKVSSNEIIEVKTSDTLKFVVPEKTNEMLKEIYKSSEYKENITDTTVNYLDNFTANSEYEISFKNEVPGSILRYFVCEETSSDSISASCYPSCYTARFYIKIVD